MTYNSAGGGSCTVKTCAEDDNVTGLWHIWQGDNLISMDEIYGNLLIWDFGEGPYASRFIIGEVVLIHVKDEFYVSGEIEMSRLKSIGRLGGDFYCRTTHMFEMPRPESAKVG